MILSRQSCPQLLPASTTDSPAASASAEVCVDPKLLNLLGEIPQRGQKLPLHAAALWLHSNRPGTREEQPDAPPCHLTLTESIALYPDATGPRLPLLGLRALTQNHLHLTIDGQQRMVSLRTPDWHTRLLRWLA